VAAAGKTQTVRRLADGEHLLPRERFATGRWITHRSSWDGVQTTQHEVKVPLLWPVICSLQQHSSSWIRNESVVVGWPPTAISSHPTGCTHGIWKQGIYPARDNSCSLHPRRARILENGEEGRPRGVESTAGLSALPLKYEDEPAVPSIS
jgi:hypothetical protein